MYRSSGCTAVHKRIASAVVVVSTRMTACLVSPILLLCHHVSLVVALNLVSSSCRPKPSENTCCALCPRCEEDSSSCSISPCICCWRIRTFNQGRRASRRSYCTSLVRSLVPHPSFYFVNARSSATILLISGSEGAPAALVSAFFPQRRNV